MTLWQRWVRQPQSVLLRKAFFQIHLWSGLALSLYIIAICVSGSILVYRNELNRAFANRPRMFDGPGQLMSAAEIEALARRAYPGYELSPIRRNNRRPNQAMEFTLTRGRENFRRAFHPYTGEDLGNPLSLVFRSVSWLLDLHDNLLFGRTGRKVNGIGAFSLLLFCLSGAIIWWPGKKSWRKSLGIERRNGWRRFNWTAHSALGFWFFAMTLMFGVTGAYLTFPQIFSDFFDRIQPYNANSTEERLVDTIQYWLAYAHFGRFGARSVPHCGTVCDQSIKFVWFVSGLVPPAMAVTGGFMWYARVAKPWAQRAGLSFKVQRSKVLVQSLEP